MREMTASEASRNFSALLDSVAAGETVVVTRGGKQVATVAPAEQDNWAAFAEIVRKRREEGPIQDDSMERAIEEMRTLVSSDYDTDPWAD